MDLHGCSTSQHTDDAQNSSHTRWRTRCSISRLPISWNNSFDRMTYRSSFFIGRFGPCSISIITASMISLFFFNTFIEISSTTFRLGDSMAAKRMQDLFTRYVHGGINSAG